MSVAREVELIGGPRDGATMVVRVGPRSLFVPCVPLHGGGWIIDAYELTDEKSKAGRPIMRHVGRRSTQGEREGGR